MVHLFTKVFIIFLVIVNKISADDDDDDDIIDISHLGPKAFGVPDLKAGEQLSNWDPEKGGNADEQGTYLQGDILFPITQGKNGIIDVTKRWPGGLIPYIISGSFNVDQLGMISAAMNQYAIHTCVRFVARTTQSDYINIKSENTGCWSPIGRVGGEQILNLQIPGCFNLVGISIHEMMHTVGFFHEHTRWERDDFITVVLDNVKPDDVSNFDTIPLTKAYDYGVLYDYGSVLHYSSAVSSINGSDTIIPKHKANIGQRTGFSNRDILKINYMYNCAILPQTTANKPSTGWLTTLITYILTFFRLAVSDEMVNNIHEDNVTEINL